MLKNMNPTKQPTRLQAKFENWTYNTPEGNDSGGGGGAPASDGLSGFEGGGGQVQEDAGHSFNNAPEPSAQDNQDIQDILALEGTEHSLSMDQIAKLIGANPTFPKATPQTAPSATPVTGANGVPAPSAAAPVPAAQPAAPALDPNVSALVTALQQVVSAPAPSAEPQGGGQPTEPQPYYGGVVPAMKVSEPLLRDLLGVEEGVAIPEKAAGAMNYLVNGIMNKLQQDTMASMLQMANAIVGHIPRAVQGHTTAATNTQKFYSDYPEFDNPAFKDPINGITNAIVQDMTSKGQTVDRGSPEFRKRVGEAMHLYFEKTYGVKLPRKGKPQAAPSAAPAQPAPAAQAKPAPNGKFYTPGGARPPAAPGAHLNGQGNESADLRSFVI